jgi:hypothetical protein
MKTYKCQANIQQWQMQFFIKLLVVINVFAEVRKASV